MRTRGQPGDSEPLDVLAIELQVALFQARRDSPDHWIRQMLERCHRQIEAVMVDREAPDYLVRSTRARAKSAVALWRSLRDRRR